ncbi:MAG: insulinase family protein, partial [Oscillospiraceae bacterium]
FGDLQILSLSITGIKSSLALEGEDLLKEYAELVADCVINPNVSGNAFDEGVFQTEKQNLIDEIRSELNDKRSYAVGKCRSEMLKGKRSAIKKYGTEETANLVTAENAKEAYDNMISGARIEIMFVGSEEPQNLDSLFADKFKSIKRNPVQYEKEQTNYEVTKTNEITEEMDITQGKLVLGMKLCGGDIDETAAKFAVALYGGTATSLLFKNVREKLSLCYYCAARYDKSVNIIFVDSGIMQENKQKAQDEILRQLEILKKGEFSDEDMLNTRLVLKTSLKSVTDYLSSIENWYLTQILTDKKNTPEDELLKLDNITREDITKVANKIYPDTFYLLKGKGDK